MATKPTFVFVPGAWHGPEAFDAPAAILKSKGYGTAYINLPSVGADPQPQDFSSDVALITKTVEDLLAAGDDVVVVMHSYGGAPGCEAMKPFLENNTGSNGRGKVIRLAWICAFVLPEGGCLMAGLGFQDLPWFQVEGDVVTPKPGTPKDIFYSDISDSVAEPWISKLKTHSYRTFYSTMTIEPWLQIPSSYLICTLDAAIPLPVQEMMIEAAQKKNPKAFDLVERIEAGHSPFLSKPEATAAYLERAASVA